jgi:hypothetical protein
MASSPEKKDPPSCGSRDSQPIPCTDDPPLSESPTTDLGCHDPRDEDADHPAPPMGKGDIDEDSDDDGYADEETTCPGNTTNNPVESFDSRLKDEQILSLF